MGSQAFAAEFDMDVEELPDSVDQRAVRRIKFVAWALDDSVRVPGTNRHVGLDPILGVIPGSGDVAAAAISLYIVAESARLGVTQSTLVRMLANVAVDTGVGAIPVLGDLFDAGWKANKRNVELALEDLAESADAAGDAAEDSTTIPVES